MGCAWTWLALALASGITGPQREPGWWVDASSAAVGAWSVRRALPCEAEDGALGVAVVVYSRKQGTMAWGHASVRAVGCRGGQPFDHEYETYAVSRGNWPEIQRVLAGDPVLDDRAYWKRQRSHLFAFRNDDPVDAGFYAEAHAHNREIYELWLDLTPEEAQEVVDQLEATLDEQARRLAAREELAGRYRALSTNCTQPIQQLLPGGWHLPFRWLRELEGAARLRVLHPSRHLLGRWEEVPARVERRPHPLFRRRRPTGPVEAAGPLLPVDGAWPRGLEGEGAGSEEGGRR